MLINTPTPIPDTYRGGRLNFLRFSSSTERPQKLDPRCRLAATHFNDPAAAADVLIRDGQEVLKQVQAKSYGKAADAVRTLAEPKYEGMDRLIPSDQVDHAQAVIDRYQKPLW